MVGFIFSLVCLEKIGICMEFLPIHLFLKMGQVQNIVDSHSSTLCYLNAMADSSTFVQSVENPWHNVDVCINSALAKAIEENRHNSFCQCILFCGQ